MTIVHRPITTRGKPSTRPWAVYSATGRYRHAFSLRIHAERFAGIARRIVR